jgi:hypothetical protein
MRKRAGRCPEPARSGHAGRIGRAKGPGASPRSAGKRVEQPAVRAMFSLYWLLILFGIVFFIVVGLAHA